VKRPAVFLDRDGTINEEMGYINHPSRFVLLDGVGEALSALNRSGFLVMVMTNQSGVARGYFPLELLTEIHERMKGLLALKGARIDAVYFCPHHPDGVVPEYSFGCDCRKPKTGMFRQAMQDFDIELERSFVVGDRLKDMEFAKACGVTGVMVETGYGKGEIEYLLPASPHKPAKIAANLGEAVEWILSL
jgi:D-glycero-D-manno-heptose 1,7-bisphosphate phosphatase